jgi:hypothetical protein
MSTQTDPIVRPGRRKRRAFSRDPVVQAAKVLLEAERSRRAMRHYLNAFWRDGGNIRDAAHHRYLQQGVDRAEAAFDHAREALAKATREDK